VVRFQLPHWQIHILVLLDPLKETKMDISFSFYPCTHLHVGPLSVLGVRKAFWITTNVPHPVCSRPFVAPHVDLNGCWNYVTFAVFSV
jgi:hypothetical protein